MGRLSLYSAGPSPAVTSLKEPTSHAVPLIVSNDRLNASGGGLCRGLELPFMADVIVNGFYNTWRLLVVNHREAKGQDWMADSRDIGCGSDKHG